MNGERDVSTGRRWRRAVSFRRPETVGQWAWLVVCLAWVAFALYIVIWTTVYTWHGAHPEEDFTFLGQLTIAAPASWIALLPVFLLPQEPIGPDGGGGISDGWQLAIQALTCVLVVVQGWLVYLIGPRPRGEPIPVSNDAKSARTGP